MAWKKGESGNLKGGPKKEQTITAAFNALLQKRVPDWFINDSKLAKEIKGKKFTYKDAFAYTALHQALQGDAVWGKLVMSYTDGVPKQDIDVDAVLNITLTKRLLK